jgi:predicted DNA-binding transcriptional regulator AlpA
MLPDQELQLIPQPRVQELLGISAMTLWRWQKAATFPVAKLKNGRKYFFAKEIKSWIDAQDEGDGTRPTPKND